MEKSNKNLSIAIIVLLSIIVVALIIGIALVFFKYEKLEDKYEDMEDKYTSEKYIDNMDTSDGESVSTEDNQSDTNNNDSSANSSDKTTNTNSSTSSSNKTTSTNGSTSSSNKTTSTNSSTSSTNNTTSTNNSSSSKYISRDKALQTALNSLNVSKNSIYDLDIELENKARYQKVVYEVSFDYNNYEYEYYIDATSGKILDSFKSRD